MTISFHESAKALDEFAQAQNDFKLAVSIFEAGRGMRSVVEGLTQQPRQFTSE